MTFVPLRRLLSALALFAAYSTANANLVVNPGFETGDFSGWSQINDTSFTSVTTDPVAVHSGTYGAAFGPTDPGGGGILQDLSTVAGQVYDVEFWLGNIGGTPNTFGLFWNGGFVDIDFDLDPFGYTLRTISLTATAVTTNIGFIFYQRPSFWVLDDISVTAGVNRVPESGTLPLAALGLIALGLTRRRRQRSAA